MSRPERLVHGPLTCLMLLELASFHNLDMVPKSFEYRALNPLVVGRTVNLHSAWRGRESMFVWAEDENQVVGMTGMITF